MQPSCTFKIGRVRSPAMNAAGAQLAPASLPKMSSGNNFRPAWFKRYCLASMFTGMKSAAPARVVVVAPAANSRDKARYPRLVRISDHACDAGNRSQFGGSTLRIAARDDDARPGIGGVDFPHGFPRLRIRRRRNRARVQHNDAGGVVAGARVSPEFSSSWRMAAASASVARQPKFSIENVAMVFAGSHVRRGKL